MAEVDAMSVDTELPADTPPTPMSPNMSLTRVGTMFHDGKDNAEEDAGFYVLGSIGRLCNDVDDITLESSSTRTAPSSNSPEMAPLQRIARVPTAYDRDNPVFSWESRTSTLKDDGTSLEDMIQKRRNAGSSLAPPQTDDDPSDDETSEAPSVGQFRPGTDLIQCPVNTCERTFKWKKNLHHHIRDKHPTDAAGLSVMRIQPAHVGAAHNGFRLQSLAVAPPPASVIPTPTVDPSLRCPECGKIFIRKGDLVHHKRYHTRSTDRPYKCDQCGQGFIHHKDLARHMPRHTGQRSFQCPFPECHKNYTRKDNLNRHMRHDHGGLDANGAVWTGVQDFAVAPSIHMPPHLQPRPQPQLQPQPPPPPQPLPQAQTQRYDPPREPTIPASHLAAIAEAASNYTLPHESSVQQQPNTYPPYVEPRTQHTQHDLSVRNGTPQPPQQDSRMSSSTPEASVRNGSLPANGVHQQTTPIPLNRETTPSLGKHARALETPDVDRLATGLKPKRKPKEKWAHRLGCPYRKSRNSVFTTENGFRVCETTPHEFIIRLIEHMKRNHELYVCGECFLGFISSDSLGSHKGSGHHCGKCYLSFADEKSFIDHANTCIAVEAATQEDIWQILYETLCGDAMRHNPSFDDDEPTIDDEGIKPSNRLRMRILDERKLAPGQVPSLSKQLKDTPLSMENGMVPPVVQRVDSSQQGQSPEMDGAWSKDSPDKDGKSLEEAVRYANAALLASDLVLQAVQAL